MENFPKIISSCPETDQNSNDFEKSQSSYVNCNICRNFSNILKVNHRKSKEHQKKMSDRFRVIRNQIKKLGLSTVSVHDEDWHKKESLFCYFCDKSVEKHKVSDGLMVESFGYMTHLVSYEHANAVKRYLKYHERKEKFELFCKTEKQFIRFLEKISLSRKKYLEKMDRFNMQDVQSIRDIEKQRQRFIAETVQAPKPYCDPTSSGSHIPSSNVMPSKVQVKTNKLDDQVPPWLTGENENKPHMSKKSTSPVIGPTIETFNMHAADQKKKHLPSKRLRKKKSTSKYSDGWMPDFRGVWNKGKRKYCQG